MTTRTRATLKAWQKAAYKDSVGDMDDLIDTMASLNEDVATDTEALAKTDTGKVLVASNLAAIGATATFAGLVELATTAEASGGSDTSRAVTAAGLAAYCPAASESAAGKVELATTAEAAGGSDTSRAVTAAGLAAYCPASSESAAGKVELATTAEAAGGADTSRAVTAAGLAAYCPAASESAAGKVELATTTEASGGADTSRAVTAAGLAAYCPAASTTAAGKIELATDAEAKAGTATERALTPDNLVQGAPAVSAGTLEGMFVNHYRVTPAAVSATAVHAAVAMPASDTTTVTTEITNPDFPRTVTVKGNAVGIAGNVVVNGTNIAGTVIQDTIALDGSNEVEGLEAFKTVTSFVIPARNAEGDTVSVGIAKKFGMPKVISFALLLLLKIFDGSSDASGTLNVSADLERNLYSLDGTPDGSKHLDLYYLV